jgi:hypothetical protein
MELKTALKSKTAAYLSLYRGTRFRLQMPPKPLGSKAGNFFESAGLFEKMRCTRHDP